MKIEMSILLSVISVCFTGLFGFAMYLRNKKTDDQSEASQTATILTELKSIKEGITDIKKEVQDIKAEARADHDEIVRQGVSLKSAWASLNEMRQFMQSEKERVKGNQHERKSI
jgi:uncharacterized protein involved in exopolysaccharide biosynthesis